MPVLLSCRLPHGAVQRGKAHDPDDDLVAGGQEPLPGGRLPRRRIHLHCARLHLSLHPSQDWTHVRTLSNLDLCVREADEAVKHTSVAWS